MSLLVETPDLLETVECWSSIFLERFLSPCLFLVDLLCGFHFFALVYFLKFLRAPAQVFLDSSMSVFRSYLVPNFAMSARHTVTTNFCWFFYLAAGGACFDN